MTTSRGGWSLTENVVIAACVSLDEPAIRRFHRNPQLRMDITLKERVQLQSGLRAVNPQAKNPCFTALRAGSN
jgi:hypothetical protein